MKIQKIEFFQHNKQNNKETTPIVQTSQPDITMSVGLRSQFNDHKIAFKARVEKDLESFYERNKNRMPETVKTFVESLEDKSEFTPLEAQWYAFDKLENAKTIQDVQSAYPDEPLFKYLTHPSQIHATRGLISCYNENAELLALSGQGALKDDTDLTTYLVKKVFLEAKTIDEINKDLENDLDPDLKADFKYKNPNSRYVYSSTLKALGIETPNFEYQQSLRYTRDGYSDLVGDKIKGALRDFINSLSDTERTARAKKSVLKFEQWWSSLTFKEKLALLAEEENTLEMLKSFKKATRKKEKAEKATNTTENSTTTKESNKKPIKVGSQMLSHDELFKKWATNHLKIFEAQMTEADKDSLHIKRMFNLSRKWKEMSAQERTDYISKMKAGKLPMRYAMMEAWNNSMDIIKSLSQHLRENQIYKPADLLYSTEMFSNFQSRVMTEFWEKYPEFAIKFGDRIRSAQEKVELSITRGHFTELQNQIIRDKKQRIKEMEKFKATQIKTVSTQTETIEEAEYKTEFKKAYESHVYGKLKSIPQNYYNDMYANILNDLPKDVVELWIENLKGKALDEETKTYLESYLYNESDQAARCNRALEAAMADTLYEITGDPDVYTMSSSDVKTATYHAEKNEYPIKIYSHKTNKNFILEPLPNKRHKKPDVARINLLYEKYKEDLSALEIDEIIKYYFKDNEENTVKELRQLTPNMDEKSLAELDNMIATQRMLLQKCIRKYIATYGKSIEILFSDKSAYPLSVREKMHEKFIQNAPEEFKKQSLITSLFSESNAFDKEKDINRIGYLLSERFSFVPREYFRSYLQEFHSELRFNSANVIKNVLDSKAYNKRKDTKGNMPIIMLHKDGFTFKNKLKTLAIEKALADILYDATGCEDIYKMEFEMLCDNIEIFNLVKKFPSEERTYPLRDENKNIVLKANKKPQTAKLARLYKQYTDEIASWLESLKEDKSIDMTDLLYILNPNEDMSHLDKYIIERFKKMGFNTPNLN